MARATGTTGTKTTAETPPRGSKNDDVAPSVAPRSSEIAKNGVRTGDDFANLMSALMSDVIEGTISPNVANAAVNAGGKLLKVVEMQYRYGVPKTDTRNLTLTLAPG